MAAFGGDTVQEIAVALMRVLFDIFLCVSSCPIEGKYSFQTSNTLCIFFHIEVFHTLSYTPELETSLDILLRASQAVLHTTANRSLGSELLANSYTPRQHTPHPHTLILLTALLIERPTNGLRSASYRTLAYKHIR